MLRRLALIVLLFAPVAVAAADAGAPPALKRAHAHNDYEHERPLLDAVSHGFRSVEADVWLVDGELLVAHDREEVRPERRLESLYLNPLRRLVRAGVVERFTLMIDFKSEGAATYRALADRLPAYDEMLARVSGDELRPGAVSIVISGNRPFTEIGAEKVRYVGIDGRPSDLDSDLPPHLMPWISERWGSVFAWDGAGDFPDDQRKRLREFVAAAHERNRIVRFWATPETEAMWRELIAADVDLINTDKLAELQAFLNKNDRGQ